MTEIDLSAFLMAHAGFRQEFGLLAAVTEQPLEPPRARLAEDQLATVLEMLHTHHTSEDADLWPLLRERAPDSAAELDALEAEHGRIDPLLRTAGDARRPLAERAGVLRELHRVVNEHLDHEERVALPLIRTHVAPAEWQELGDRAIRAIDRRRMPVIAGWMNSAADDELGRAAMGTAPLVLRLLTVVVWRRAYRRRARRLYGPLAPSTA